VIKDLVTGGFEPICYPKVDRGAKASARFYYTDGLGDFLARSDALRELGPAWWRKTTVPPEGDASAVILGLRGGCNVPLWRHLTRGGAAVRSGDVKMCR
jgi:hypothetical protein